MERLNGRDAEVTGEDRTLALNPHYLLDALTGIGAPTAELAFAPSGKGRRVLITPTGTDSEPGTDHRHVVMPVRLAG